MRKLLFDLVAKITATIIVSVQFLSSSTTLVVGVVGHFFMRLVDSKRLKTYEALLEPEQDTGELKQQGLELKLLAAAQQVRDHAKDQDDWTDHHTDALNAIGEALIVELDWEEDNVHTYLRELVESIDGLEYGAEEW